MKRTMFAVYFLFLANLVWAGPIDKSVDHILEDYFRIQSALANDTTDGIDTAAQSIHEKAVSIAGTESEVNRLVDDIRGAANRIQRAPDLEAARSEFFELSKPLLIYLNKYHSAKNTYYRYFCPMAKKGWLQSGEETRNPYHGSSMLSCGTLIE